MKNENIQTNGVQINANNINDTSTNQSTSFEMESFEIENPLLINGNKRKESSDYYIINNTKEYITKKFAYPANILSTLSFNWVYDVIKKSKKNKNLQFSNLGEVSPNYKSEIIFKEIETKWYGKYYYLLTQLKEMKKRSIFPLFMTLIQANYWRIVFSMILYMAIGALDFIGVFMFKELLSHFKEKKEFDINRTQNEDDEEEITFLKSLSLNQLIILMILHKVVSLLLNRQTQFISDLISIRTTTQLNLLIYDKLLKIPTFNMNIFNEGKIINLFQIDSESFGEFIINLNLPLFLEF